MKSECLIAEKEKVEMITLIHMQTGFYLLAIGYLLALFSLIVEVIVKLRQAHAQIMGENIAAQEKISVLQEKLRSLQSDNADASTTQKINNEEGDILDQSGYGM